MESIAAPSTMRPAPFLFGLAAHHESMDICDLSLNATKFRVDAQNFTPAAKNCQLIPTTTRAIGTITPQR